MHGLANAVCHESLPFIWNTHRHRKTQTHTHSLLFSPNRIKLFGGSMWAGRRAESWLMISLEHVIVEFVHRSASFFNIVIKPREVISSSSKHGCKDCVFNSVDTVEKLLTNGELRAELWGEFFIWRISRLGMKLFKLALLLNLEGNCAAFQQSDWPAEQLLFARWSRYVQSREQNGHISTACPVLHCGITSQQKPQVSKVNCCLAGKVHVSPKGSKLYPKFTHRLSSLVLFCRVPETANIKALMTIGSISINQ